MSPAHLQPGDLVDGWRVMRRLGAGSFGAVYLVEKDGRRCAMKLAMHRSGSGDAEKAHERLMQEVVCLIQVRGHPHIVQVHGYGHWPDSAQGWLYVVLDYVEGYTLGEWVERMHPTALEVARLFVKLASALAHMHGLGVHHRDLKPGNIVVGASSGEPVILDLGAGEYARAPELTDTPLPPGTRRYRSPEASRFLREHGDERGARYEFKATDDVYALGVCLYDVLTMAQPARMPPRVVVEGRWMPPAPHAVNSRVPAVLGDLALRFIARQPERRPATAEVMRRELEALLLQTGEAWMSPLHPPASQLPPEETSRPEAEAVAARSSRWHLLAGVAGVVFLAVLGAFLMTRPAPPVTPTLPAPGPSPATARDAGPALTTPPASGTQSPTVALPPPAPVQKESPPVKRAPASMPRPADSNARKQRPPASGTGWPPMRWAQLLKLCTGATVAAALQLGCPGAQVRPEPADCPAEARDIMFNRERKDGLGMRAGTSVMLTIDRRQPGPPRDSGVYGDGPVTGVVRVSDWELLPEGTLMSGYLWTHGEEVVGRYTEAQLPDGRTVPICFVLGEDGYIPADHKRPGSKPGAVVLARTYPAYSVKRWP
ncbi:protein kinase [Pyxidicoccus parkwayensis]|uniref:Protein kinase n=2 Tax=Pyxidicoccus parkwayensis TaxID=2813578 RepID=A0ABX7PD64_9BACT|nr:protein kinase [Pyxidicoccus parkwaysis]